MANTTIEVAVTSTVPNAPAYCTVMIANCDAMHVATQRQQTNGHAPACFIDAPPGRYYIVVVPEGGNARHTRFRLIDGTSDYTSFTFDLFAIDPTGKITAIVLIGDHRAPGIVVTIRGQRDGYFEQSMTDINGTATFSSVPETQAYELTACHGSTSQGVVCDLVVSPTYEEIISFP